MKNFFTRLRPAFFALAIAAGLATPAAANDFCYDEEWMSFEDWREWTPVNQEPVVSYAHGENWVGIFANDLALETYRNVGSSYQVCSAVAKAIYMTVNGEVVKNMTVMVKMPPGYDPEYSDWWYGRVDSTGTLISTGGRLEDCLACHEAAYESDYLFSDDVMETVREWFGWQDEDS